MAQFILLFCNYNVSVPHLHNFAKNYHYPKKIFSEPSIISLIFTPPQSDFRKALSDKQSSSQYGTCIWPTFEEVFRQLMKTQLGMAFPK